jgi:hypothetical protein
MGASDDLIDNAHGGNRQNEDHYVDDYDPCWFHNVDVDSETPEGFLRLQERPCPEGSEEMPKSRPLSDFRKK